MTELAHIVCLGASAGGLQALEEFFDALPKGTGASFVVVVHLSPDFKSLMPEILAKRTTMPVAPVTDEVHMLPEHVYVLPPGKNLEIDGRILRLTTQVRGPGRPINLPIDLFLSDLAAQAGETGVAVILSGTGSDGTRGIRDIKESGGVILVQDPESAKFDGMPRSAIQTGLVDHVGVPADLARKILNLADPPPELEDNAPGQATIERVVSLLRSRRGSEHSFYRRPMIARRIRRRMAICGIAELDAYCELLATDPAEVDTLRQDLLIGVTCFFRDPWAFESLQTNVLNKLVLSGDTGSQLRVWVAACSSGQEVYSLAILLMEAMLTSGCQRQVKIFATDINETALARAAQGQYSLSEMAEVPVEYVSKYFEQRGQKYVVRQDIRNLVIFAPHNVVTDPPFTRLDLVSCRNLLIYLKGDVQRRVLTTLHFAVKPKTGVMFLGTAEVAGVLEDVITPIDERARIYRRSGAAVMPRTSPTSRDPERSGPAARKPAPFDDRMRRALEASFEAEKISAALVTHGGKLVELITDPNGLFRLAKGTPSTSLIHFLPPDIVAAFSAAEARLNRSKEMSAFAVRGVRGNEIRMKLVKLDQDKRDGHLLLELTPQEVSNQQESISMDEASLERIVQLEDEVRTTRETLQATIEELQSTNEEQQSTNEELVAANEELQSTNEELHSVNEELFTVNAEFQRKNRDLQLMTSDLDNLLASMEVGTLFLDAELRVRRFTGLGRVVKLMAHDVGRQITDFAHQLSHDFLTDVAKVAETGLPLDREVRDSTGAWLLMRARPYRTINELQEGVLLTFVEVTKLKNAEETARVVSASLREANHSLATQADQLEEMFSIVAHDLRRPVLGLDGLLALAQQHSAPPDATTYIQKARTILGSLRTLLKDLASVSQQNRIDLKMEDVELKVWFDRLLKPFRARAIEHGFEFNRVCDTGSVRFARAAGEAALVNLVENAVLYGTGGESPSIDVSCRVMGGRLHLIVSDNGQGIAPADHTRVFELFRRLSPDAVEGSGVGLVSVRRLVQRAKGELKLDSELGSGARFYVTLPVDAPPDVRPRILLVEDDALDAKAARRALPNCNIHVECDLAAARVALETNRFDLVLLDLALPDGHGLSLMSSVRSGSLVTPVIILSGHPDGVQEELLEGADVDAIISKDSLQSSKFKELVTKCLQKNEN